MQSIRQELRREMRQRRRALSNRERQAAARAVASRLRSLMHLRHNLRVAIYLSAGAELDTAPLLALLRRHGCRIFVPRVRGERETLIFLPLQPPLQTSRFGIPEPRLEPHRRVDPRNLDLVLVPLLAFGPRGERLGSGLGFYDQTFAFLRQRRAWKKPRLVGLAYHWQGVQRLQSEQWDVPLSAVVTDREVVRFTG